MDDILIKTVSAENLTAEQFNIIKEMQRNVFENKESWQGMGFFSRTRRDGEYFLLKVGSDPAAVCSIDICEEKEGFQEIRMFFVSPEYVRQGLGSTLLAFALSRRRNRDEKFVIVRIPMQDEGARRFVSRFGFNEIERDDKIVTYAAVL